MNKKKILFFILIILAPRLSESQESVLQSDTIGGEATELKIPSSQILESEPQPLTDVETDIRNFILDSTVKFNFRTIYFSRDEHFDGDDNNNQRASWAAGGSVAFKSGKIEEVFDIRAELFHAQKLYGPLDKDGALVLKPGQEDYTTFGVVNPRFQYKGHILSLYRQRHDMPYVNSQDNRMTPNTFESYVYGFVGSDDKAPVKFGVGYLDKIKRRNDSDFVHLTEAAGISSGEKRGMPWFGFRVLPTERISFSAINYSLIDSLNILYSEVDFSTKLNENVGIKTTLQYSNQTAIGTKLLDYQSDSTEMAGGFLALSYKSIILRTSLTANTSSGNLISPFGTYPGYTGSIVEDFNRAGEIAWKLGVSYDFSSIRLKGLSAYLDYIKGNNAVDNDKQGLPDKSELDVNIDYRPRDGFLSGFWLRIRGGFVDSESAGSATDLRFIINHEFPVL